MPELTNLNLARIIKHLEAARSDANAGGEDLVLLTYLIDTALLEARAKAEDRSR
jgi:hypothetical protein